jgi:ketosteroid isomerase-like protein
MDRDNHAVTARNADVIRRLFECVERRDLQGVLAAFDDAVVVNEPPSLPYGGQYSGPNAVVRHAQGYLATWNDRQEADDRRLDPEIIAQGEHVAVMWRQRGHDRSTGRSIDSPVVSLYRLANGKVVEARMFHFDTAQLLDFFGQARRPL